MPTISVLDSHLHYEDTGAPGTGPTWVFLHGNPVSSHLWRKVLPSVQRLGRCLTPDLIGMGQSGKPDMAYGYDDHARYLAAWFDAMDLQDVVLVGIDWGASLAFDWARRHAHRVRGIAFMETIVKPMAWADFPAAVRPRFEAFRTPGLGEQLALAQNQFLAGSLTATVLTPLSAADRAVYEAPYPTPASRRPLLAWPRAMPIEGSPADVVARVEAYGDWLASSHAVPKLLLTFTGSPTLMIGPAMEAWCRENIARLTVQACGDAGHLAPEDQPVRIADALLAWADTALLPAAIASGSRPAGSHRTSA
ncbi:putative hydrolase or acyltransferase of alpha/beta superfamily [Acidovorax sp. CF316]|uniref:haloalkane dehalogenase n=1 Tax=Acidovorax sp. CF316 TaxID=1144317 RepID=UPI00026BC043|nr:haloalkane dehalogenase [Acidovorax sp. CF316]EJE48533.1 putative hydrolase or acyltransferase of alpha/beta superfamily [Acidovorax sp. CF316]